MVTKKAVLFYKKLERKELTPEELEEKKRKDKKLAELEKQKLDDKLRETGWFLQSVVTPVLILAQP